MRSAVGRELARRTWKIPPVGNYPLRRLNTFQIGGPADFLLSIADEREAEAAMGIFSATGVPWLVLGKGSNALFADEGFRGVVLKLEGAFKTISLGSDRFLSVGAGVANGALCSFCRRSGLGDLEFLSTVPGTVGGAVFMNAGAFGKEIKDVCVGAKIVDESGEIRALAPAELGFAYRHSSLWQRKTAVLEARFRCSDSPPATVAGKSGEMARLRRASQPTQSRNWGSVFRNPEGSFAGELIERCGLKGAGFGDARISSKHANFIENLDRADFSDTLATIRLARDEVKKIFDVELIPEVRIFSETGEILAI